MIGNSSLIIKMWTTGLVLFAGYLIFMYGRLDASHDSKTFVSFVSRQKDTTIAVLNQEVAQRNEILITKEQEIASLNNNQNNLKQEINSLEGKVKGLSEQKNVIYPFAVPTNGYIGNFAGSYGGNMYGFRHLGVDVWTTLENNGQLNSHKGNSVFSACNGIVDNLDRENGGLTIKCDPIDPIFIVPNYEVYTYFGHMGNALTSQMYNIVGPGTRVQKGQKIGQQGDLSSYFPEMRNVHLHFSVFAGLSETDKKSGAYNPCVYIGGDCTMLGSRFQTPYN